MAAVDGGTHQVQRPPGAYRAAQLSAVEYSVNSVRYSRCGGYAKHSAMAPTPTITTVLPKSSGCGQRSHRASAWLRNSRGKSRSIDSI